MNFDSIIFDLDGTLWDSTDVVVIAWNEVLKKHKELNINKNITIDDLKSIMGLQICEIGKVFFPELSEELQLSLIKECCDIECGFLCDMGGKLYDGLEETLTKLTQKYKLYIVSNCQCGYIESFLSAHKMDKYFADFENPGRTGLSKGENIKLLMERNNLKNPVYVGDTAGDYKAATFAGIPFIYARYGFGDVQNCEKAIDSFKELLDL